MFVTPFGFFKLKNVLAGSNRELESTQKGDWGPLHRTIVSTVENNGAASVQRSAVVLKAAKFEVLDGRKKKNIWCSGPFIIII